MIDRRYISSPDKTPEPGHQQAAQYAPREQKCKRGFFTVADAVRSTSGINACGTRNASKVISPQTEPPRNATQAEQGREKTAVKRPLFFTSFTFLTQLAPLLRPILPARWKVCTRALGGNARTARPEKIDLPQESRTHAISSCQGTRCCGPPRLVCHFHEPCTTFSTLRTA